MQVHNVIKKIFKKHLGKNKIGFLDNPLNCPCCNTISGINTFDFFDGELMFYCCYCYSELLYNEVLKYYDNDLEEIKKIIHSIDKKSINKDFAKKILFDFITEAFEHCIDIKYDRFCNCYYNELMNKYFDEVTL